MQNQVQTLGSRMNGRSRPVKDRWDQFVALVGDPAFIAVISVSAIGLFASLLFALWAPLSNDAAAIFTAVP